MSDKNTFFQQKKTLNVGGKLLDLSKPRVMGILNLTPDSFYDGGRNNALPFALKQTERMLDEGAELIDLGAYSSRPGAANISAEEESERLLPVLKAIRQEFPQALISIDTFRAKVAEKALTEGVHIINDISGGELDPEMYPTVARLNAPYILMHMKGNPQNMHQDIHYDDVFSEVSQYFIQKVKLLQDMGVKDIIIDPGFGFAKKLEHNYTLLSRLEDFHFLGLPLLIGVSRKSMIQKVIGCTAEEALNGTSVVNTISLMKGAAILRVHDVRAAVEAVKIVEKMRATE